MLNTIEGFELSPQQKHLWLLQQNNSAYQVQLAISITGNLDVAILKSAFDKLINKYEILRTRFHKIPNFKFPIQCICDRPHIYWQEIDLTSLAWEQQQDRITELFEAKKNYYFNLQSEIVMRCHLLSISPQQHTLILTLPALCADSKTLNNLVQEISNFYSQTAHYDVNESPIQYAQFSAWQNEIIAETDIGREYWQEHHIDKFLSFKLPLENQTAVKSEFQPQSLAIQLCPDIVAQIKAFAQECKTSTSEFLLTCFAILLSRLTQQPDIVIAVLFDGRSHESLQSAFGLFAKYLPIHFHLENDYNFYQALQAIAQSSTEVHARQDYFSWEQIFPELENIEECPSLFCFEFEQLQPDYPNNGILLAIAQKYVCFEPFKIKLSCLEQADTITTEFHYNSTLFSADSIAILADQFQTLLTNIIHQSNIVISQLPLLSPIEKQLLINWNNTQTEYSQDKCIHQLFAAQVEQTPDKIAVVFQDQQLTYRELNSQANQLAHYLQALGVTADVPVGIYLERSLDMVVGLLAILKAGGAYVPLDPTYPQERLAFMLADTQISVLLTYKKLVEGITQDALHIICLDKDRELIKSQNSENLANQVTADNLAYIIYTSGSTGKPKGISLAHRPLINLLQWHNSTLLTGVRTLQFASLSFDASFHEIFATWLSGGTLFIVSEELRVDVIKLGKYISAHSIEKVIIPVVVLQQLAEFVGDFGVAPLHIEMFPHLQEITTTGEQLQITKHIINFFKALKHCSLHNHYGPSETHVVTALKLSSNPDEWSYHPPIGTPIANTQIHILDSRLNPVPIGVIGELYIGGVSLARGYLNRPDLTNERFIPDPFSKETGSRLYKTGDLARYLLDGNIDYLGRIDHQVKVRGFRIELGEIEAVLNQHPDVNKAVVLAQPDTTNQQRLIAYIVSNQALQEATNDFYSFLQQKLPEYMIPSAFIFLKSLPLTSNGKIDRQALLNINLDDYLFKANFIAPRTAAEKVIANIWKQTLGVNQIGIYDNFFALGGHSLLATQVFFKLNKIFQVELSLSQLFETPTVAGLLEVITQQLGGGDVVENIAQILLEIQQFSPEEVREMLDK
ncbi:MULTISPECIES: non-ribosomal peptide synthetase [unclassified Tolypothrix]|uniref:non-ribosomal peptide synthetase n=1 Tax=unclassified Tolypothrix TaxID=2649714 RepID=UPI0005EAC04A|nr:MULTISPECIES: non-ribosomal peptide synthetase [unclassified Tolypothrix]BAY91325.1 AMP-dependent synthetase and ligase [Microchaete diplosiphon NIES-3275]EKF04551.1 AMP-binding enzyme [Tolypothrix sp. PCC 7601]MBE9080981.1 non-ribosomal peptide synthetase [Tolypothrix sp. LEGE 11397]UYD25390.1 non-ribosomal peptide synthetase [Tolypothrix sp. PCC 7712]UYD32366.1 non-ribosomal peptide synthetase [Tolypothrix sp. PCC 7601]